MKLKKLIIFIVLTICRPFSLMQKINPDKITFISLESDSLNGDFKMISRALEDHYDYRLNYILIKFEKTLGGNIKYFFTCIRQLFAINSSKLVILDYNNYVVSAFKRRGVKVLQLWHASGAIKAFGNEVNRDYEIKHYNYVICNSPYFKESYANAFGVDESKVKVTGIPKTDLLFSKRQANRDRRLVYERFPQLKGKKVILYAPTFRGRLMHGFKGDYINLDYIQKELGDEYIVAYKMHPLLRDKLISSSDQVVCCNGVSIRALFAVSDLLISDYSAIIIDYSISGKPMIFYVPDLDEYREEVGLFVDYEKEMPGPICKSEDEVIKAIKDDQFDAKALKNFRDKMFRYQDGNSLNRVMKLIIKIMGGRYEKILD